MTTTRGRLRLRSILTLYHAGLWQRSLRGWRHGLALGEGSGLLGSRRGSFFSHCRAGFISLPGQVRRFPAQYIIGGQPSTTTKATCTTREKSSLTSLTGQQSRSECQVCWRCRQVRLWRAPLLRLELLLVLQQQQSRPAPSCTLLLSMTGACGSTTVVDRCVNRDTSSSTVGAGLRLLSVGSPTVSQSPSSPWSTRSEGEISCKHSEFSCQHTQILQDKYLPRSLPLEM
jgi:hypothetical protein